MPQNLSRGLPNVTTTIAPGENGPDETGTEPGVFRLELAFSRHEFAGMERLSPPPPKLATVILAALLKDLRFQRCGNQSATLE
jgi:hypothetical protein